MVTWADFAAGAPEFATRALTLLDAHRHKILATVRADGSPRLSGIEGNVARGEYWFGAMWQSRKALDLWRDARFAIQSGTEEPPAWRGDARISGRAVEVVDQAEVRAIQAEIGGEAPEGPFHLFRAELTEIVVTSLNAAGDRLVIESWRPGASVIRVERE
jgi:hypothetical protein